MDSNLFYSGLFPPQRMCAKLDEANLLQFIGYWVMHGKPCPLSLYKGKDNPALVGVCFTVKNDDRETMEFMVNAVAKTGAILINLTEEKEKKT